MNSINEIKDYFTICNNIRELNSKIMFVGILNERGRLVAGGMSDEIKSMINRKFYEALFMQVVLKVKMRKEFDKQLGSVNFTMSQRDKILAVVIPIVIFGVIFGTTDFMREDDIAFQKMFTTVSPEVTFAEHVDKNPNVNYGSFASDVLN